MFDIFLGGLNIGMFFLGLYLPIALLRFFRHFFINLMEGIANDTADKDVERAGTPNRGRQAKTLHG